MLLAIDVGNTQTVIGLYGLEDGDEATGSGAERDLLDHWRIATNAERTSDELALLVQEFLASTGSASTRTSTASRCARRCRASPRPSAR